MLQCDLVAEKVGQGEILTRKEIAVRLGREKTTALISHIERAVREGLLEKQWAKIGNNSGWAYAQPGTFQTMPGWA